MQQEKLECMLKQFQQKILQVQSLKSNIKQQMQMSEHNKIISQYVKTQFKPWIIKTLEQFNGFQIQSIGKMKTYYDEHIRSLKRYYEQQIEQLKGQIKRQYKVIGMMKQQVQDLMFMLNQNQLQKSKQQKSQQQLEYREQTIQNDQKQNKNKENESKCFPIYQNETNNNNKLMNGVQLQVIQQQQYTQRTILSSARSNSDNNPNTNSNMNLNLNLNRSEKLDNFIKIQDQFQQNEQSLTKRRNQQQQQLENQQFQQELNKKNTLDRKQNIQQQQFQLKTSIKSDDYQHKQNQQQINRSILLINQNTTLQKDQQNKSIVEKYLQNNINQNQIIIINKRKQQQQLTFQINAQLVQSLKIHNNIQTNITLKRQQKNKLIFSKTLFSYQQEQQDYQQSQLNLQPPLDNYQFQQKSNTNKTNNLLSLIQNKQDTIKSIKNNYHHHNQSSYSFSSNKKNHYFQINQILLQLDNQNSLQLTQDNLSCIKYHKKQQSQRKKNQYQSLNVSKNAPFWKQNKINQSTNKNQISFQNNLFSQINNCQNSNSNTSSNTNINTPLSNISKRENQFFDHNISQRSINNINQNLNDPNFKTNIIKDDKIKQPKTKEFLEEFRKTFNKCLSSMQAKHKYSNKINAKHAKNILIGHNQNNSDLNILNNNSNSANMQVTFGKQKKITESAPSQSYEKQKRKKQNTKENIQSYLSHEKIKNGNQEKGQSQYDKIIYQMVKNRQKSSKFIVGQKKNQVKYQGSKIDSLRHGNGLILYNNGLCFQGQFKNGVRQGYGILKFNHIQIYNGNWANDELNGQGKIRNCAIINKKKSQLGSSQSFLNKWISYCGQFKNNMFNGQGTLYLQGGEKFIGKFVAGVAQGQGALYRKNGQIQQGIWKNNLLIKI